MCNFIFPKFHFQVEKWRWSKEFRIYVSNHGHFKDEHKNNIPIKINDKGYVLIETPYGIKSAHRLVMYTFKPIPNAEILTVDHLDHNKRNNCIDNLEWVSQDENQRRAKEDLVLTYDIEEGKIRNGLGMNFNSYKDAAAWLYKYFDLGKTPTPPNKNKLVNKIKKAVLTKTPYWNIIWVKGE